MATLATETSVSSFSSGNGDHDDRSAEASRNSKGSFLFNRKPNELSSTPKAALNTSTKRSQKQSTISSTNLESQPVIEEMKDVSVDEETYDLEEVDHSKQTLRTKIDSFYNRYKETRRKRSPRVTKAKEKGVGLIAPVPDYGEGSEELKHASKPEEEKSSSSFVELDRSTTTSTHHAQMKNPNIDRYDNSQTKEDLTKSDALLALELQQTDSDALLASELQKQLEIEEMNERQRLAADDAEIAKTIWEQEKDLVSQHTSNTISQLHRRKTLESNDSIRPLITRSLIDERSLSWVSPQRTKQSIDRSNSMRILAENASPLSFARSPSSRSVRSSYSLASSPSPRANSGRQGTGDLLLNRTSKVNLEIGSLESSRGRNGLLPNHSEPVPLSSLAQASSGHSYYQQRPNSSTNAMNHVTAEQNHNLRQAIANDFNRRHNCQTLDVTESEALHDSRADLFSPPLLHEPRLSTRNSLEQGTSGFPSAGDCDDRIDMLEQMVLQSKYQKPKRHKKPVQQHQYQMESKELETSSHSAHGSRGEPYRGHRLDLSNSLSKKLTGSSSHEMNGLDDSSSHSIRSMSSESQRSYRNTTGSTNAATDRSSRSGGLLKTVQRYQGPVQPVNDLDSRSSHGRSSMNTYDHAYETPRSDTGIGHRSSHIRPIQSIDDHEFQREQSFRLNSSRRHIQGVVPASKSNVIAHGSAGNLNMSNASNLDAFTQDDEEDDPWERVQRKLREQKLELSKRPKSSSRPSQRKSNDMLSSTSSHGSGHRRERTPLDDSGSNRSRRLNTARSYSSDMLIPLDVDEAPSSDFDRAQGRRVGNMPDNRERTATRMQRSNSISRPRSPTNDDRNMSRYERSDAGVLPNREEIRSAGRNGERMASSRRVESMAVDRRSMPLQRSSSRTISRSPTRSEMMNSRGPNMSQHPQTLQRAKSAARSIRSSDEVPDDRRADVRRNSGSEGIQTNSGNRLERLEHMFRQQLREQQQQNRPQYNDLGSSTHSRQIDLLPSSSHHDRTSNDGGRRQNSFELGSTHSRRSDISEHGRHQSRS